jgi:hypothetical protein
MFNIHPLDIWLLPPFLEEVRPWKSPEYLVAIGLFALSAGFALRQAPHVRRFTSIPAALLAFLAVLGIADVDQAATAATRGTYRAAPLPGQPFSSATHVSGLAKPPADGRDVVIIIVEALGSPTGAVEKALYQADWDRPDWRQRYDVGHGVVPYYGSTTNGELRELCGVWGEYARFDFTRADCLPSHYDKAGYESWAMHSFASEFFSRDEWYPKLAFEHLEFGPQLLKEGARKCGGVFPGACDEDIPALIGKRIKAARKPQLIYWLTLNSHLPVLADDRLGTKNCDFGPHDWASDNPHICRLFLLHHRLADAIGAMAMDPKLPPTDILIVGDHMPPFFDRGSRLRFDGTKVPWIYLKAKTGSERVSVR